MRGTLQVMFLTSEVPVWPQTWLQPGKSQHRARERLQELHAGVHIQQRGREGDECYCLSSMDDCSAISAARS